MSYADFSSLPVYRKALELYQMSQEIASYVSLRSNLIQQYRISSHRDEIAHSLVIDAKLITKKIVLAQRTSCRKERLKIAVYISIISRNISAYCKGLEQDGVREVEYINLLRQELNGFRSSFKQWRSSIAGEM